MVTFWKELQNWMDEENISPIQACISYVYSLKEVDSVIIGVLSCTQLQEILDNIIKTDFKIPQFSIDDKDFLLNPSNWNRL